MIETVYEWLSPEQKDFSEHKENLLVDIASEVNDCIEDDPITDFLCKVVLHLPFVNMIAKEWEIYTECVIDYYDYVEDTIRRIFMQARDCDTWYSKKVDRERRYVESSGSLINNLAELIVPETKLKTNRNISIKLDDFWTDNDNLVVDKLDHWQVKYYVKNNSGDDLFTRNSKDIYNDLDVDNKLNDEILKYFKGKEEEYMDIVNYLYEGKGEAQLEDIVNGLLKKILKDSTLVAMLTSALNATGITDYAKGYARLLVLRQLEGQINNQYIEAKNDLLNYNGNERNALIEKSDRYVKLYNIMKEVEIDIQNTYKSMYPNDVEKQVSCNETMLYIDKYYDIEDEIRILKETGAEGVTDTYLEWVEE